MIEAREFLEPARKLGFEWYMGVPCSFLTPFINYVVGDPSLKYVSSANEGDALATAAGITTGGKRAVVMMQNSGLGNAVSPLTSLTYTFKIPVLLICTQRGAPGLKDEPQHELIGRITGQLLDLMEVPWEPFPMNAAEIPRVLERVLESMRTKHIPYALVMGQQVISPHPLASKPEKKKNTGASRRSFSWQDNRPSRNEALRRIVELTSDNTAVVIATTGYTGRELFAIADRPNHLYMVGSMGCASSLGLGLSLVRPNLKVVVIDGDGAALMRMGNIATVGAYGGKNFTHILLDNEAHESTGGQETVSAGVFFAGVAEACGYSVVAEGDDLSLLDSLLGSSALSGPRFLHLKIKRGTPKDLPRPTTAPHAVLRRLMKHIGT
ncbi:MAG: phosphonopyruvate decarboxylase [Gammaproteobacteria bacterium]